MRAFACVDLCVRMSAHLCIYLHPLVWLWSDTWCRCVVPPVIAPSLPSLSFYRKLIGSCHWCVKLLCVGYSRQLDYLFFIFSILKQLPSALVLFLNEAVSFPPPIVALKDVTAANVRWQEVWYSMLWCLEENLFCLFSKYYEININAQAQCTVLLKPSFQYMWLNEKKLILGGALNVLWGLVQHVLTQHQHFGM